MNLYIVEYTTEYTYKGYLVVQALDEVSAEIFSLEYVNEPDMKVLSIEKHDGSAGIVFSFVRE